MAGSSITSPAVGTWTLVSGTGTFANANSPTTSVTGLGVGQNIFQWTVNNGPCANGITTDQMSFFVYDPNNPTANAGPDQNLCTSIGNSITLEGSPVIFPATGVWTVIRWSGHHRGSEYPITLVTGLVTGNYWLHVDGEQWGMPGPDLKQHVLGRGGRWQCTSRTGRPGSEPMRAHQVS